MADVTIGVMLKKLYAIKEAIPGTIKEAIWQNEAKILKMQRQQLYDGKNSKGEDIHPFYSEDPYFKTSGQAKGYIKWKQAITPNSKRNPDAPNLYIKGYTHQNIILVEENGYIYFTINPRLIWADEVLNKYDNLLGLYGTNKEYLENEIINPKIWELYAR